MFIDVVMLAYVPVIQPSDNFSSENKLYKTHEIRFQSSPLSPNTT